MSDLTLQEKIARLPAWARKHIKMLEVRAEPAIEEAARARRKLEASENTRRRLACRLDAVLDLIQRAATTAGAGGDYAATIVKVLEDYEVFPNDHQPKPEE